MGADRTLLRHLMGTSPLRQTYFSLGGGGWGVVYRVKIYLSRCGVGFFWPATVCGIPMPYGSGCGFAPESSLPDIADGLAKDQKGMLMVVGLGAKGPAIPGWTWKRYLPAVEVRVAWANIGEYLQSFRSPYRRRLQAAIKKGQGLRHSTGTGADFNDRAYELYRALGAGHRYRQHPRELLDKRFFTDFPWEHSYLYIKKDDAVVAWSLLVPRGRDLIFLLGGFDPGEIEKHDIYKNMLLGIVRHGIERGYQRIHLGQTAETAKFRMGGRMAERYLLVRHSNPAINWALANSDAFEYRACHPPARLFRRGVDEVA